MQIGIRNKLIGLLGICSLAPLIIGLILLFHAGERHYMAQRGELFRIVSQNIAHDLEFALNQQIDNLHSWTAYSGLVTWVERQIQEIPALMKGEFAADIDSIEERWADLEPDHPTLKIFLDNQVARALVRLQSRYPLFAELLLTDATGRLVAATNKTSDYWQADEEWWIRASGLQADGVWIEGIHFDESAAVYSFDVALPLMDASSPSGPPIGVIKGVIDITPLFSMLRETQAVAGAASQLVLKDGLILTSLFGVGEDAEKDSLSPEIIERISAQQTGWIVGDFGQEQEHLIGFKALDFSTPLSTDLNLRGVKSLFIVVHDKAADVLAPFRRQLLLLAWLGGGCIFMFMALGLYLVDRRIVRPLRRLHHAARLIGRGAGLPGEALEKQGIKESDSHKAALNSIEQVERINTHDEIKLLADAFGRMGRRVLNYHVQLEEELQLKTEEIDSDLRIAREPSTDYPCRRSNNPWIPSCTQS